LFASVFLSSSHVLKIRTINKLIKLKFFGATNLSIEPVDILR
jgi:hypothetical protein